MKAGDFPSKHICPQGKEGTFPTDEVSGVYSEPVVSNKGSGSSVFTASIYRLNNGPL